MKSLVISDQEIPDRLFNESVLVNLNNIQFARCTGGLECLKNGGKCHFQDDMTIISDWIAKTPLIIYVSRIEYGEFTNPFKKVIERQICKAEPYYEADEESTFHAGHAKRKKKLLVLGYGDITPEEEDSFKRYLKSSSLPYSFTSIDTYFCKEDEVTDVLQMFGGVDHESSGTEGGA